MTKEYGPNETIREEAKENDIMLQEFEEVRFSANGSVELNKCKGELARLAELNENQIKNNNSSSNSKANSRAVSRDEFEGGGFPDVLKTDDSITSINSKPGSARLSNRSKPGSRSNSRPGSRSNARPGSRSNSRPGTRGGAEAAFADDDNDAFPNIEGASSVSWGKGESQELALLDDRKTRTQRRETPAEKFDKLVSFIKASKQSPSQLPIDQVVDEWTKLSRF